MFRSLAVLGAALATAAVVAETASAAGGLSVSPSRLEATARAGASGNVDDHELVDPQAEGHGAGAAVAAVEQRYRGGQSQPQARAGAHRAVEVHALARRVADGHGQLRRVPARRSLYGALDILGKPAKRRKGINVAYRLVSSLRFNPAAGRRKLRLSAGGAGDHRQRARAACSCSGSRTAATRSTRSAARSASRAGRRSQRRHRPVGIVPGKTIR